MKQKDLALILIIVFISATISLLISKVFITSPKNRTTKVQVVEKITTDFPQPDSRFFNINAVDPTVLITIGNSSAPTPFNAGH
ncbi:MAG: hypothetical protein JWS12_586 [Candidatus Saccharibacteria bacterium]|nr:hypothetical protein [Candidatus Saccharibacteria bacterium]